MNANDFDFVVKQQLKKAQEVLLAKRGEYATEDTLHNFRKAANLQGITLPAALAGFMAKHTVSIYDMCEASEPFTIEQWEEKIGDHINYLLILKAIVVEGMLATELEQDEPLPFPTTFVTNDLSQAQEDRES